MNADAKKTLTLTALSLVFLPLAVAFVFNLWGHTAPPPSTKLVDLKFVNPAPVRESISAILRAGGDPSDYECNLCHEKNKPIILKFDEDNNIILPKEHSDIALSHGSHKRNNNCYNCHDEMNVEQFQTRDGRVLKITDPDVSGLCGSCHGPTYADWEAGVHGRTSGYWNKTLGEPQRLGCTSCHNPHSPKFPSREPAPGPQALHPVTSSHPHAATERKPE